MLWGPCPSCANAVYVIPAMNALQQSSFLRVPPFPGAGPAAFAVPTDSEELAGDTERLLELVRSLRVGGDYWEKQPKLPDGPYILLRIANTSELSSILADLPSDSNLVCWTERAPRERVTNVDYISGPCDPWHLVEFASLVIVDADDELALIAAIAGVPVSTVGSGLYAALSDANELAGVFQRAAVDRTSYRNPFSNDPTSFEAAAHICGYWRQLIDGNRHIARAMGFAFWKRPTVEPLLWGGSNVKFVSRAVDAAGSEKIAVWKSRIPPSVLSELERSDAELMEVEDGFIRSAGLGADCVPPLSIVVDSLGVHFDPSRESELERLIQNGRFSAEVLERARLLRKFIVSSGLSKYGAGPRPQQERGQSQQYLLVPGQVEDDRSVLCGGGDVRGNLELLRRARRERPDAYILYKPHPDVEAGHRVGGIADELCLEFANEVVRDQPISTLIELVDEVHVNTSLAGFEALLRGKAVTTHGVPFYAGWGLTRDLGPVPERRTAKRAIDELVAAVLLQYPRYLDPITGLPCPPEILVRRLVEGESGSRRRLVVQIRRLQGRLKKRLADFGVSR